MEQWSDGRPDGMAQSSGRLTRNQNLRRAKSSESALNRGIPIYSIITHTSDFVQTQNEAKILTQLVFITLFYPLAILGQKSLDRFGNTFPVQTKNYSPFLSQRDKG
jgi:hypothetical protein